MRDNYAAEVKTLTQHIGAHPDSMVFARLADRYLLLREVDKALDICQRGLRNHPNYVSAHFVLAKCYLARKQYDEAERRLKHVLSLDPHYLNAHKLYSDMMAEIGWTPQRNSSLQKLNDLDPFFPYQAVEAEQTAAVIEPEFEPAPLVAEPPAVEPEPAATMMDLQEADAIPEEIEPPPVQPQVLTPDIDVLPDVQEPEAGIGSEFENEEARFSEILDELFSPNIAEEEQRESQKRLTLERAARVSTTPAAQPVAETPDVKQPDRSAAESAAPVAPAPAVDRNVSPVIPFPMEESWSQREEVSAPPSSPSQPPVSQESDASPLEFRRSEDQIDLEPRVPSPFDYKTGPAPEPAEQELLQDDVEPGERSLDEQEDDLADFLSRLERMAEENGMAANTSDRGGAEMQEDQAPQSPKFVADEPPVQLEYEEHKEKTKEKFVTPTLGEIYAAQGQYAKAISVFELLLKKNPDNEWYKTKLDYLRKRLAEEKQ